MVRCIIIVYVFEQYSALSASLGCLNAVCPVPLTQGLRKFAVVSAVHVATRIDAVTLTKGGSRERYTTSEASWGARKPFRPVGCFQEPTALNMQRTSPSGQFANEAVGTPWRFRYNVFHAEFSMQIVLSCRTV